MSIHEIIPDYYLTLIDFPASFPSHTPLGSGDIGSRKQNEDEWINGIKMVCDTFLHIRYSSVRTIWQYVYSE